jgi:ABC-type nickel/cobalt efflux system permease component RcnA
MFKRLLIGLAVATAFNLLPTDFAAAHPLDVAYLDFAATSTGPWLTVAVHPYQAFELVRGGSSMRFDVTRLQQNGALVTAYVASHVDVSQNGKTCTWSPGDAVTPDTELDAVANGVTVAGPLQCPTLSHVLTVGSTLFLEGFPSQTSILRLEESDAFPEQATLDHDHLTGAIDLSPLYESAVSSSATTTQVVGRTQDAAIADIARRLLDPGIGWWGMIGLLASAALIGALHALGPGHGKSLMAATLVAERATAGRMVLLGTVMTLTHVSDVFLMALLAGTVAAVLPPTQLLIDLEIVSAAALVVFGVVNGVRAILRYRTVMNNPTAALDDEAHARAHALGLPHEHGPVEAHTHDHEHTHDGHSHDHGHKTDSFRQALWLGFVGSLAPCPTAWAIFMATLSLGRLVMGVLLLVAFTIGLHLTILAIGSLLLISKKYAMRRTSPRFTYALPIFSACVIVGLGIVLLVRDILG